MDVSDTAGATPCAFASCESPAVRVLRDGLTDQTLSLCARHGEVLSGAMMLSRIMSLAVKLSTYWEVEPKRESQ